MGALVEIHSVSGGSQRAAPGASVNSDGFQRTKSKRETVLQAVLCPPIGVHVRKRSD